MSDPQSPNLRRRRRFQLRRRRHQPAETALLPPDVLGTRSVAAEEALKAEIEQLKGRIQRLQADHENHRKRVAREREEQVKFALEEIMRELILSNDNFERAMEHRAHTPEVEAFAKGLELSHRQFEDTLTKHGIEKIPAQGLPFNPHVHEAITAEEAEGVEEGTILEVVLEGYSLHGRVIRPALVKVAKGAENSDSAAD